MRRPRPFDPNMLRLGPGRVSGMAAGKPANGEGDGNGENHSGNGNSFHGYRTHLWPGEMLSAENLPYLNAN